jgi:hypothetical protein
MKTLLLLAFLAGAVCNAQETAEEPPTAAPKVKQMADGVLDLGGVRVDRKARTIRFPAAVNMNDGMIEYLLVGKGGKTHESLFVTEIQPYYLHLAMLLLGAKGNPVDQSLQNAPPPSTISADYLKNAPQLKGDPVEITVAWKIGDQEHAGNVEDFISNLEQKRTMRHGPWTYNGSMFYGGKFLAQSDLSIAAMVTDPEALINNRQPGHDNDQIWSVDPAKTPKVRTPVELTIQIEDKKTP